MKAFRLIPILALVGLSAGASAWTLDKVPDLGPYWNPLGPAFNPDGTPIYANSFVYDGPGGESIMNAGVYMQIRDEGSPPVQFLLLADDADSPSDTILSTSVGTVSTDATELVLVTSAMSAFAMANGTRYWLAARSNTGSGNYQVGGHTQNSIYADNGTFWYSNADDLNKWDGQALTPEMAIYIDTVPEPATIAVLALGLGALIARRRK